MLNDVGSHGTALGKCAHQYEEKLGNKNTQAVSFFSSSFFFFFLQFSVICNL